MQRAPLTKGEIRLLIAVTLFVVLVGGLCWWQDEMDAAPVVVFPPNPPLPSPNAYDYYREAGFMPISCPMEPSDAIRAYRDGTLLPGPPRPWVWGKAPRPPDPTTPPSKPPPPGATLTPAQKLAAIPPGDRITTGDVDRTLALYAPQIAALRKGFAYPCRMQHVRSIKTLFPELSKFRAMARILSLVGSRRAEQRAYGESVTCILDGLQLGIESPRGGMLIHHLVGIACASIVRAPAWRILPHLSASDARAATRRLEQILQRRTPLADILTEDKYNIQASYQELFRKPRFEWLGGNFSLQYASSEDRMKMARLYCVSKRRIMADLTQYFDAGIADARLPYARRLPLPALPADPLSHDYLMPLDTVRFRYVRAVVQDNLLLATLALQAYRAEHGSYPTALSALASVYLTRLPDDPFAVNGPLRYKRTAAGYVLYSIGPDGKDNGGTPSKDGQPSTTGPSGFTERSTGDIVAGVNTVM